MYLFFALVILADVSSYSFYNEYQMYPVIAFTMNTRPKLISERYQSAIFFCSPGHLLTIELTFAIWFYQLSKYRPTLSSYFLVAIYVSS